jgi:hypothetical protein
MPRLLPIAVFLVCITSSPGQVRKTVTLGYDLDGRPVSRLVDSGTKVGALFFLATDCPISNRYVPEMKRLQAEFASRPVAFWLVYPNAGETAEAVRSHNAAYGLETPEFRTLLHPTAALAAIAAATITPEAALLVPRKANPAKLQEVYLGRIDDRYLDIGRQRPQATRHDLEDAVTAVFSNKTVPPPGGPPVGCGIITPAIAGKP